MAAAFGDDSMFPRLREALDNPRADAELRRHAFAVLSRAQDRASLRVFLRLLDEASFRFRTISLLARFDSPTSRVLIAEHEGATLGFVAVHALPRFEHDDWILRILALVVDAGARERGVGRGLMAEAERIGGELGASFVELTAGHHRPEARHLYEALGYDATVTAYLRKKL